MVEILYAAPANIFRKCDSRSCGSAVEVAHSLKAAPLGTWDWRKLARSEASEQAFNSMANDDKKGTVDELETAPEGPSLLLAQEPVPSVPVFNQKHSHLLLDSLRSPCSTPSTADPEDLSHSESDEAVPALSSRAPPAVARQPPPAMADVVRAALQKNLAGEWVGGMGESYRILFDSMSRWTVLRSDANGTRKYVLIFCEELGCIWWGEGRTFYLDCSELLGQPDQVRLYPSSEMNQQHRRARFTWHRRAEPAYTGLDKSAAQRMTHTHRVQKRNQQWKQWSGCAAMPYEAQLSGYPMFQQSWQW